MAESIIVYGHAACPSVGPITGLLKHSQVPFEYVDIHHDPVAASRVRTINQGHESVPTLVFPDGSTLTEPTVFALQAKLSKFGYKVTPLAWLVGNFWLILLVLGILLAVLRALGVF